MKFKSVERPVEICRMPVTVFAAERLTRRALNVEHKYALYDT